MRIRLQQLHLIAGLQVCVSLLLLAVVGLAATLHHRPGHEGPQASVAERIIKTSPDLPDVDRARQVAEALDVPMALPPGWVDHDESGAITFMLYPPNAEHVVTYDGKTGHTSVKTTPRSIGQYLIYMHTMGGIKRPGHGWDVRLILWSLYVEFTALSLIFLSGSGVYMFLRNKRKDRIAGVALLVSLSLVGFVVAMVR